MIAWERWAGEQIGKKYSLDKLLSAEGSHASFLASSHRSPSEQIVITFSPAEPESDGWARYILGLRHPHLRLILGAGEESIRGEEWRCIAVERADSLLSDRLAREGPLPTPLARQLGAQLVEALHYLHGKNLVYRNLKPETVARIGAVWKLADFSMVRPAGQANPKQTRALLTSSPQAPPDAYTGLISPGWDIYSLGVTLNQCLLGDETDRGGRLRLPDPFESIVRGCLEPEPQDRITLDEIAGMLGLNSLNQQPLNGPAREWRSVTIHSHIPIIKPAEKRRRERRWLGFICLILLCEVLALVFLSSARWKPIPPSKQVVQEAAIPEPIPASAPAPGLDPAAAKREIGALLKHWLSTIKSPVLDWGRSKPVPPSTPALRVAAIPEVKPAAAPEPDLDPAAAKREIGAFLKHWLSTIQSRDLEGQIDCYAPVVEPFFRSSRADRSVVKREKQRVFARIGKVRALTIDNLTYESLAVDRAVVSFRKEWDIGGSHRSSGVEDERLTLRRIDGQWKIGGEEENNIRWVKRS